MRLLLVYLLTRALTCFLIHSHTFTGSFIHTFPQSSAPLFIHLSTHTLTHWSFVPSPIHTPLHSLTLLPQRTQQRHLPAIYPSHLGLTLSHIANPRHPRNVLSSPSRHPLESWSSCLPLYYRIQQLSGFSLHLSLGMVSASVLLRKMREVQKDPAPVPGDGWNISEVT